MHEKKKKYNKRGQKKTKTKKQQKMTRHLEKSDVVRLNLRVFFVSFRYIGQIML